MDLLSALLVQILVQGRERQTIADPPHLSVHQLRGDKPEEEGQGWDRVTDFVWDGRVSWGRNWQEAKGHTGRVASKCKGPEAAAGLVCQVW